MRTLNLCILAALSATPAEAARQTSPLGTTVIQTGARLDINVPAKSIDWYIRELRNKGYRLETFTATDNGSYYTLSSRKAVGPKWAFYPNVESHKAETFIKVKAKESYRLKRVEQFVVYANKDFHERCALLFEQKKGGQVAFVKRGNKSLNEIRAYYKGKGYRLTHFDLGQNVTVGTAEWNGGPFKESPQVHSYPAWAFVMEVPKVKTWWRPFLKISTLHDLVQARNAKGYSLTSLTVGYGLPYPYYESGMKSKPVNGAQRKEGSIFQAVFQKWQQNKSVLDSGMSRQQLASQFKARTKNGMRLMQIVTYGGKFAAVWRKPSRAGSPLQVHHVPAKPKPPKPVAPHFTDDPYDPTGGANIPTPRPRPKPRFPTVGGFTKDPFDPTWDPTPPPNSTPTPKPKPKPAIPTVGGLVDQPRVPTSKPKPGVGRGKRANPEVIYSPRYKKRRPNPPRRRVPPRRKK